MVTYESLKTKEKSTWIILKVVTVQELFSTKFKSVKMGFHKGGRN